jgi:hypothetical protein
MDDEQLIEQIVRSVLEQFQRGENISRTDKASGGRKPSDSNNAVLSIEDTIITGDLLASQVNGNKTVNIGQHAILTPSARDLVRQRGITIQRQTGTATQTADGSRWVAIVTKCTPALKTAIDDAIQSPGAIVSRELVGTNDEAVQTAVGLICRADADGAIIFSEHPQLAACLANRNRRIRAATADNAATMKAVIDAMGANLLCINPVDQQFFGLRNILRQLPTDGPPQTPQNWTE